jgi:hypothetical protein
MKSPRAWPAWLTALFATPILAVAGCITPTPRVAPPSGLYTCPETVTITDGKAGAKIFYTTDGSAPTTVSTKYTAPFAVATTDKVRAIALAPGDRVSRIADVSYACRFNRGDFAVLMQRRFALPQPAKPVEFFDVRSTDPIFSAIESVAIYIDPLVLCPGCVLSRNFSPDQPITRGIATISLVRMLAARGQLQILSASESDAVLSNSADAKRLQPLARRYFATAIARRILVLRPDNRIDIAAPNTRSEITEVLDRVQTQFKLAEGTPQ